jgi:hypothetical protein
MKRPQKLAVMLVPTPPYEICGLERWSLGQRFLKSPFASPMAKQTQRCLAIHAFCANSIVEFALSSTSPQKRKKSYAFVST